ncbi:MAG: RHS repeat-associated core domain-containing protein [Candidatus Thiodiazotropha sp. DIVDIV]
MYLHTDHLGAVVKATDEVQAVVWDVDRKPFGERESLVGQVEVPLGFPGQYFDEETNNYYNYFRDYDPTTGRYLQSDPIGLAGGLNTYVYVNGNPLIYTDPKGLDVRREATGAACGFHERVAVDVAGGQFGVSFGHSRGAVGGVVDYVCPSCYGDYDGVIYEDGDPATDVLDSIDTKPCQDKNIFKWLYSQIGKSYSYTINGYNCRAYSTVMMMLIRQKLNNGDFDDGCECEK